MSRRILSVLVAMTIGGLAAATEGLLRPAPVLAHGGGLDSRGCHNDRQRGGYHCHQGQLAGRAFASASEAIAALAQRTAPEPAPPAPQPSRLLATPQAAPTPAVTARATNCGLARPLFEQLVAARMQTYESTGESWSPRAAQWRREIQANTTAGRATAALDAAYGRYSRYCTEGDTFMAGVAVGEWVGGALRAPS